MSEGGDPLTLNTEADVQTEFGLRVDLTLVVPAVPRHGRTDGEAPGHGGGGEPAHHHPQSRVRAEDQPAHRQDRHVGPPQPGDGHGAQGTVDVGHGAFQDGGLLVLHLDQLVDGDEVRPWLLTVCDRLAPDRQAGLSLHLLLLSGAGRVSEDQHGQDEAGLHPLSDGQEKCLSLPLSQLSHIFCLFS